MAVEGGVADGAAEAVGVPALVSHLQQPLVVYHLAAAVADVVHQAALLLDPHCRLVGLLVLRVMELRLGVLHLLLHLGDPGAHLYSHDGHCHCVMGIAHCRNCGDRLSTTVPSLLTSASRLPPTNGGPPWPGQPTPPATFLEKTRDKLY